MGFRVYRAWCFGFIGLGIWGYKVIGFEVEGFGV